MQVAAVYFGYFASLMLIIALLVSNDLKFRWFNAAGNIAFIAYAMILGAIPVLITNGILLAINAYYLVKVYSHLERFDLLEFTGEEAMAKKFIRFHRDDIRAYFPDFEEVQLKGKLNFVVLRDLVIANIFCAELKSGGDAEVILNYTLNKYRDFKVGRYIFDKEKQFLVEKGVKRIVYTSVANKNHERFLKVMGFAGEGSCWVKELN